MVMDLYELTMAEGYFKSGDQPRVAFDVFYCKVLDGGGFAIFAGLEQIIEYVENLHFDESDVSYLRSLNLFSEDFLNYLHKFHFLSLLQLGPPAEPAVLIVGIRLAGKGNGV